ncbi:DUF423 domain-containing protein [Algibacillus agarilyticus]|uniref:DUF423 domain-containing protein n=1 Tax=Algibacillus agarilyticus TaxID=2234133 RepID=UPI000DD054DB|nr:DUF423 domain-containing protein [Algibacillus agarilyticus]
MPLYKILFVSACLFLALAVSLGAFAAHALKNSLNLASLEAVQTAVEYQFFHALGLLALSILYKYQSDRSVLISALSLIVGIIFFSGSLYGLAVFEWSFLWPLTPIGGLAFIFAWLNLGYFGVKRF